MTAFSHIMETMKKNCQLKWHLSAIHTVQCFFYIWNYSHSPYSLPAITVISIRLQVEGKNGRSYSDNLAQHRYLRLFLECINEGQILQTLSKKWGSEVYNALFKKTREEDERSI